LPLPHLKVGMQGLPGVGQVKFGSTLQIPLQPSPGTLFPSSQSSES
jgi:hypothetical protein